MSTVIKREIPIDTRIDRSNRTRNDELGDSVLGHLKYACDIPAAEACYH